MAVTAIGAYDGIRPMAPRLGIRGIGLNLLGRNLDMPGNTAFWPSTTVVNTPCYDLG